MTLTAVPDEADAADILDGWSGAGCPSFADNFSTPYTETGFPLITLTSGEGLPENDNCTITMTGNATVSASFDGVVELLNGAGTNINFVSDPGGPECPSASPNCKGMTVPVDGETIAAIPYGDPVTVTSESGASVTLSGPACSAALGATVTPTECSFTMVPGDGGLGTPIAIDE